MAMPRRAEIEQEARRVVAAFYTAGTSASADDAAEWAAYALEAGFDSDALAMLAAAPKPAAWHEIEAEFRLALADVGIPFKDRKEALYDFAEDIARDLLSGSADPFRSIRILAELSRQLDDPDDLTPFYPLEDELDWRYGPQAVSLPEWKKDAVGLAEAFLAGKSSTSL